MNRRQINFFNSLLCASVVLLALTAGNWLPAATAQSRVGQVQVQVRPDHADWTYLVGQPVKFQISVIQNGYPVPGARANYKIGPEMLEPRLEKTEVVPSGGLIVDAGTMKEAGFL